MVQIVFWNMFLRQTRIADDSRTPPLNRRRLQLDLHFLHFSVAQGVSSVTFRASRPSAGLSTMAAAQPSESVSLVGSQPTHDGRREPVTGSGSAHTARRGAKYRWVSEGTSALLRLCSSEERLQISTLFRRGGQRSKQARLSRMCSPLRFLFTCRSRTLLAVLTVGTRTLVYLLPHTVHGELVTCALHQVRVQPALAVHTATAPAEVHI